MVDTALENQKGSNWKVNKTTTSIHSLHQKAQKASAMMRIANTNKNCKEYR